MNPHIDVDLGLTHTMHLNIVANKALLPMITALSDGFQQQVNAPPDSQTVLWNRERKATETPMTQPPDSPGSNPIKHQLDGLTEA